MGMGAVLELGLWTLPCPCASHLKRYPQTLLNLAMGKSYKVYSPT